MQNILILAAMDIEERALLKGRPHREEMLGERIRISSKILEIDSRHRVRIACTGIGPVNAAVAMSIAVEYVPVDAVILLGVGGALDERLDIGEVVIARHVIQHDSFASMEDGNHPMAAGELYLTGNMDTPVPHAIACDSTLVRWLSNSFAAEKTHFGALLSGSEFVGTSERKNSIARPHPNALLVDMEAAGVAQLARRLKIPFAVAKTVADRLNPDQSVSHDYQKFLAAASAHASEVLTGLVLECTKT